MRFILTIFCLLLCCTNPTTNNDDKIGFSIRTQPDNSDSTVTVCIVPNRNPGSNLIIKVNGDTPDSDTSILKNYRYLFNRIRIKAKFEYVIIYNNDTLLDSVFIPGMIDSLLFNGLYLGNQSSNNDYNVKDTENDFCISWKDKSPSNHYQLYIGAGFVPNNPIECTTIDTAFHLKAVWDSSSSEYITFISVKKSTIPDRSKFNFADKSSHQMFVYYEVEGPFYFANLTILRNKTTLNKRLQIHK